MNCKEVKELFDEYNLDLFSGDTRSHIKYHLQSCKECRSYYMDNKKLSVLMDYWEEIEPRADYISDFWKKVDDKKYSEKTGIWEYIKGFRKPVLVPSVVALLLCSMLIINIYESYNNNISFTEKDMKDEEFLNEIENIVSGDNYEMLKVYGVWHDLGKQGMEG
jgi:hypothetical protein